MRSIHSLVAVAVFGCLSPSMARAAIKVTSFQELVQTMADYLPAGGSFQIDQDSSERTVLPPITMGVSSGLAPQSSDPPFARASITGVQYTGPSVLNENAAELALSANFFTERGGLLFSSGESTAVMQLNLTLDQSHPYTLTRVGTFGPGTGRFLALTPVGGTAVPTGSGWLGPGNYVFQSVSADGFHSFDLAILVPEPVSACLLLPAVLWLRRPSGRRTGIDGKKA